MGLSDQMPLDQGVKWFEIGLSTTLFSSFATKIVGNLSKGLVLS